MANRKFQLLMSEFAQLTNGKSINLNADQSLACHYSGMDCYVEDGARIGLHGQVLVIVPIVKKLAARQQVRSIALSTLLEMVMSQRLKVTDVALFVT